MNIKRFIERLCSVSLVLFLFLSVFYIPASAEDASEMLAKVKKGVVQIAAIEDYYYQTGTGFGIGSEGKDTQYFITNWHVVTNDNGEVIDDIFIMLDNADLNDESTLVRCEVLYTTEGYPDLAVLKASEEVKGLKALALMPSESANVGSWVYALGYPGATEIGSTHSTIDDITVTSGIISKFIEASKYRFQDEYGNWQEIDFKNTKCVVHDAHINHGNSGGPLVTSAGAVIGINTYGSIGNDESMSYAVYIDYAMEALDKLGVDYDIYNPEAKAGAEETSEEKNETEDKGGSSEDKGAASENNDRPNNGVIAAIIAAVTACAAAGGTAAFVIIKKRGNKSAANNSNKNKPDSNKNKPEESEYKILTPNGQMIPVTESGITIGRDPSVCVICFSASTKGVSRSHCRLTELNGVLRITDLGSTYGTYVNQQKIPPNTALVLNRGDTFYIGESANKFTVY